MPNVEVSACLLHRKINWLFQVQTDPRWDTIGMWCHHTKERRLQFDAAWIRGGMQMIYEDFSHIIAMKYHHSFQVPRAWAVFTPNNSLIALSLRCRWMSQQFPREHRRRPSLLLSLLSKRDKRTAFASQFSFLKRPDDILRGIHK